VLAEGVDSVLRLCRAQGEGKNLMEGLTVD